jgi:hypothetical protein
MRLFLFRFFFSPSVGFVRFSFIAFLGVSQQGEFKNAIKKNCAKISSAFKESTHSLTSLFFFFFFAPPLVGVPLVGRQYKGPPI